MLGKQACRVKAAFGSYRVGDVIYPTGVYRDQLRACGLVEIFEDRPAAAPCAPVETTQGTEPETALAESRPHRVRKGRK